MKTSFCTNVFNLNDMYHALELLKNLGYDGVEFWDNYLVEANINSLKKHLDKLELQVAQICPYFDVTGSEEEVQNSLRISEKYVKLALSLGCKNIRTFTGEVSSSDADDNIYWQAVKALQQICDMGAPYGIQYPLETHDYSLMDTSKSTLKLLRDVNRSNLKVNLQVPLDYGKEDELESAEMLGDHVVHLHAHNYRGGWDNLTFLDNGDYDFKKFVNILHKKGFDGYISIEHGNYGGYDPFEIAEHEINYFKNVLFPGLKGVIEC